MSSNLPFPAEMPRLLYPGRKPVGATKLNMENEWARNADIIFMNNRNDNPPKNMVNNQDSFLRDSASGDLSYNPYNGNMTLARTDTDFLGPSIESETIDCTLESTTPHTLVLIFTVLVAPGAANRGVGGIGDTPVDNSPMASLNTSDASYLKLYVGGSNTFTNIPVSVGKRQVVIYTYAGSNQNYFYSSIKNVGLESATIQPKNGSTVSRLCMGSSYNTQLPCAFEMAYFSFGWSPSDTNELIAFAKDPYQLLIPE